MTPISELVRCAAAELRESADAPTQELRTHHLRLAAGFFVDVREQCEDPAGRGPDWTGLSREYRAAVSDAYRAIEDDVPPARLRQMKSQARYHFSAIVRERLADQPKTLTAYGLQPRSSAQKKRSRMQQARALEQAGILDEVSDTPNAAARLVHGAGYLLALAVEEGTDDADQAARQYIVQGLRRIADSVAELASSDLRDDLSRVLSLPDAERPPRAS